MYDGLSVRSTTSLKIYCPKCNEYSHLSRYSRQKVRSCALLTYSYPTFCNFLNSRYIGVVGFCHNLVIMHDFVIAYPFVIIGHKPLRSEVNKGKLASVHPNGCVRQLRDLFNIVASDQILNDKHMLVCLFYWRYNPLFLYFHSPVAGFSLLVSEVSWSHTKTRHSR